MKSKGTQKAMIINYLKANGPSTVKELAEGISNQYKKDLTCKEITNHVRIMNGHNEVEVIGRYGEVNIWGLTKSNQA